MAVCVWCEETEDAAGPSGASASDIECFSPGLGDRPHCAALRRRLAAEFEAEGLLVFRSVLGEDVVEACRRHLETVLWSEKRGGRPALAVEAWGLGLFSPSRRYPLRRAPRSIRNASYKITLRAQEEEDSPLLRLVSEPRVHAVARPNMCVYVCMCVYIDIYI